MFTEYAINSGTSSHDQIFQRKLVQINLDRFDNRRPYLSWRLRSTEQVSADKAPDINVVVS